MLILKRDCKKLRKAYEKRVDAHKRFKTSKLETK